MSVDTSIQVVRGYKIPYETLIKEVKEEIDRCECADKGKGPYCGACGISTSKRIDITQECLIPGIEDYNELMEETEDINDIFFGGALSNCGLEGGERDWVIGESVVYVDEMYDVGVKKLDDLSQKEVDEKIKKYVDKYSLKIDKSSYGLYLLQSAY